MLQSEGHRQILTRELEAVGLRLNKKPPQVSLSPSGFCRNHLKVSLTLQDSVCIDNQQTFQIFITTLPFLNASFHDVCFPSLLMDHELSIFVLVVSFEFHYQSRIVPTILIWRYGRMWTLEQVVTSWSRTRRIGSECNKV